MTTSTTTDWLAVARELGPRFKERAAAHDADDSFVADNYAELREHKVFSAGVPLELGGGGAGIADLSVMLREYAHYCSSTALALTMHTHLVALPAWRFVHEKAPVEGLLKRVAAEQLVLVSTGASDWLDSSGKLEKVDGGYRYTGHKIFASGSPMGSLLMTSGVYDDPANGPTVFHFPVPMNAPEVRVLDNWRTMGMRATGSNDVIVEGAFVPDQAMGGMRKKGSYGILHTVIMVALPLIYSVYAGIAETARDLALTHAAKKRDSTEVQLAVGEMENHLRSAQIALASAVDIASTSLPSPETSNEILIRRTLIADGAIKTVEKAVEVVGGASLFRSTGLERLWRDVQGAKFHPMPEKRQLSFTGRVTLGLNID